MASSRIAIAMPTGGIPSTPGSTALSLSPSPSFHLHHGFDTHETFAQKLEAGLELGNRFGAMLTAEETPRQQFAYIAGNWSLDNGAHNPSTSGCNTELIALREAGCYADFTFPAVGSRAQPRKSNGVYYATDGPEPKSYDSGVDVKVGGDPVGDLMIIQGPLVFDWPRGRFEGGELENYALPSPKRLDAWLRATFTCRAGRSGSSSSYTPMACRVAMNSSAPAWTQCSTRWRHTGIGRHFGSTTSLRGEMYNIIKAAEADRSGNPDDYREFDVANPGSGDSV